MKNIRQLAIESSSWKDNIKCLKNKTHTYTLCVKPEEEAGYKTLALDDDSICAIKTFPPPPRRGICFRVPSSEVE